MRAHFFFYNNQDNKEGEATSYPVAPVEMNLRKAVFATLPESNNTLSVSRAVPQPAVRVCFVDSHETETSISKLGWFGGEVLLML
jgi:hypothetical protein